MVLYKKINWKNHDDDVEKKKYASMKKKTHASMKKKYVSIKKKYASIEKKVCKYGKKRLTVIMLRKKKLTEKKTH